MYPPQYWRKRAEQFRSKAENCVNNQTRDTLRKVAKHYDQLARLAETIEKFERQKK